MYEGSVCVCCMSTDDLLDLFAPESVNTDEENLAEKLSVSLNVPISQEDGHDSICRNCVLKMKDYIAFKRQALQTMTILSSVDISKVLTSKEIQVLGLSTQKKVFQRNEKRSINTEDNKFSICDKEISNSSVNTKSYHEESNNDEYADKEVNNDGEETNNDDDEIDYNRKEINNDDGEITHSGEEGNNADEDINAYNEKINNSPKQEKSKTVPKQKILRGVGRPRKHPSGIPPYQIDKDELQCRECGELFVCHLTLKAHYNIHFGLHSCATCGKKFITHGSLTKHEKCHLKGPFPCGDCGQEFRNFNTLQSHKRMKHSINPAFRCRQCGAGFQTLQRRLLHLADAHGFTEKKYSCKYCAKRFWNAGERAKHISNKHEKKFFSCYICGLQCKRDYLRIHLKKHLPRSDNNADSNKKKPIERRFVCKLCSKAFTQKITLKHHISSHIRKGEYKGGPEYLIVDTRNPNTKNTGMLSEDETVEQYLDETFLSDDVFEDVDEQCTEEKYNEEQYIEVGDIEEQDFRKATEEFFKQKGFEEKNSEEQSFDEQYFEEQFIDEQIIDKEDMREIFTEVGFSLSSDLEM